MEIQHEMTIADKLREVKKVTGVTQKELATRLGVSFKTMSFWLNGKDTPSVKLYQASDKGNICGTVSG